MAIKYTEQESPFGEISIQADLGDGKFLFIPKDESNSDYQRYLRWLEDPTAEDEAQSL